MTADTWSVLFEYIFLAVAIAGLGFTLGMAHAMRRLPAWHFRKYFGVPPKAVRAESSIREKLEKHAQRLADCYQRRDDIRKYIRGAREDEDIKRAVGGLISCNEEIQHLLEERDTIEAWAKLCGFGKIMDSVHKEEIAIAVNV